MTMNFTELLAAANESKTGRKPGQWTPMACKIWREAEPGSSRLLEAAIAWEMGSGRKAKPDDEPMIRDYLQRMDEATAAQKAAS